MGGLVAIIGAGPCGLACARELERLGHRDWVILERGERAGGLAASVVDPAGFTWDLGGHVVFSHFGEFDALLAETMGDDVLRHERSSYVRYGDRWVPYPFQNNLRHLPPAVVTECLAGLAAAPGARPGMNFEQWMGAVFGDGIVRHFMGPYNAKVWATPAAEMSADWIADRVSVVDYERVAANVREQRDDIAWGPNNTFVFPDRGGTGEIYTRLAATLGDRVRCGREVVEVDAERRRLRTADGDTLAYHSLVSTMPLDLLVARLATRPPALDAAAAQLVHNGVLMVGVGLEAPLRDERSWMYFPGPEVPFYRATNFAKYAAANVPGGDTGRYCAYMTETAYSPHHPQPQEGIGARVADGLAAAGVVAPDTPIASVHVEDIPFAYPVPTVGRDAALGTIQPWLMARGILSRGRFGAWRYEDGNMDHAVKMGIDAARRIVTGAEEELWAGSAPEASPALS